MGWWQTNADTLARSRFVISPLAEATACLIALERGAAGHPGEHAWLATHGPAYQRRLAGDPPPAALHRTDLPRRAADLLEWVWTETVLPYWPRRKRIFEADIVARTGRLSRGGWVAALNDLRPGMR